MTIHTLLEMIFLGNAIWISIGLWFPMKPAMVEEQTIGD